MSKVQQSWRWVWAGTALLAASCSLPVDVVKVSDAKSPVKGVRYYLGRPSYSAYLSLKGAKLNASDQVVGALRVVLEQSVVPGDIYEVRPNGSWWSDTQASLTVDDKGLILGYSGGEESKALETVSAISDLVPGFAVLRETTLPDEVESFVIEHEQYLKYQKALKTALKNAQSSIKFSSKDDLSKEIKALEERLVAIQNTIKDHRFKVPKDHLTVVIDGTPIITAKTNDLWVHIDLTEGP